MSLQPELYSCGGTYLIAAESTIDGLCCDAKDFLGSAVDILNDRMETLTPAEFGAFFLMQQTLAILEELSRRLENAKDRGASGDKLKDGAALQGDQHGNE